MLLDAKCEALRRPADVVFYVEEEASVRVLRVRNNGEPDAWSGDEGDRPDDAVDRLGRGVVGTFREVGDGGDRDMALLGQFAEGCKHGPNIGIFVAVDFSHVGCHGIDYN